MVGESVMAPVGCGDDNGDHFSPGPAERRATEHERTVEPVVIVERLRTQTVDLENVVYDARRGSKFRVLLRQSTLGGVFVDDIDPGQPEPLTP